MTYTSGRWSPLTTLSAGCGTNRHGSGLFGSGASGASGGRVVVVVVNAPAEPPAPPEPLTPVRSGCSISGREIGSRCGSCGCSGSICTSFGRRIIVPQPVGSPGGTLTPDHEEEPTDAALRHHPARRHADAR